ncbi:hypothetical protein [Streptomyces sp. RLB1-9]|uniref:hypothetical protein n=1 Tax=unclassified Streptomyces TaxID=2593676 RepID=UPI001C8F59C9
MGSQALGLGACTVPEVLEDTYPGGGAVGFLLGCGLVVQSLAGFVAYPSEFYGDPAGPEFADVVAGNDLAQHADDLQQSRQQNVVIPQGIAQTGLGMAGALKIDLEAQDCNGVFPLLLGSVVGRQQAHRQ